MVKSRFAPSPTGDVHVGSLRTALYNYLYAKQNDGNFILRLEDTDRKRLKDNSVNTLIEALYTTNIIPDEGLVYENNEISQIGDNGPYIQSERLDIYKDYIQQLIDSGDAYYCFCSKERLDEVREDQLSKGLTPKYDGHCRNLSKEEVEERIANGEEYVIRLKLPEDQEIKFEDKVRGPITVNTNDLDDQVLIKADGFPTYHFAVVVDDHLMNITDVIRGEEWLPSTPKHVYLYDLFNWEKPNFIHLSNILNENHKKLSKREGDVSVSSFLEKGYLPEALVNYLALLGWSPKDNNEIFTLEELVKEFDLDRINTSGAVFDLKKLNWMNSQYIKKLDDEVLANYLEKYLEESPYKASSTIAKLLKDRIEYFKQAPELLDEILNFNEENLNDEMKELLKDEKVNILSNSLINKISSADILDAQKGQEILKQIQKEDKIKGKMLYMPTRIMLTNQMHGPDLTLIMEVLGKDEVLRRLETMKKYLEEKDNE